MDLNKIEEDLELAKTHNLPYLLIQRDIAGEWLSLTRKQEEALVEANARLMEQTEIAQAANRQAEAKQAEIDRLMLEYCPDEMSVEQMVTWEAHQREVSARNAPKIEAMVAAIPDNVIDRMASQAQAPVAAIREAILTYYDALTARQHGGVAQDKAFSAIQDALGMSWQFGVDHRAAPQQHAQAAQPCTTSAECNAQGCCNPRGRCEEAAPALPIAGELPLLPEQKDSGQVYGIIDPDYGRIYTMVRKLAWEEGYAIGLHGSFTRDLDMVAVPWADGRLCNPQKLVARILQATGLKEAHGNPGEKPHGRKVWTLLLPDFGDPRFVDLSIMPDGHQCRAAALEEAAKTCVTQNDTDWPTPLGCAAAIRALNKGGV